MENDYLTDIFNGLYLAYDHAYPNTIVAKTKVMITDSLSREHLKLRPDLEGTLLLGIEKSDGGNGRMVLPKKVGDEISILINKNKMIEYTNDGSMTWVGTFAHELTHAIDYHLLALKEKLDYYDPLLQKDKYLMFQFWSEYHARKLGYNFLHYQIDGDMNVRLNFVKNVELPHFNKQYYDNYHATNDGNIQMYETMQFLGRIAVWCDWFPEYFNMSFLKDLFRSNWIYDIFQFLQQCNSVDDIYIKSEEMSSILKETWQFQ